MSRVVLFFLANSFPKMAQNENFFGGFQTPNMEISYRKIPILHEVPKGSPQYRRMFFFKKNSFHKKFCFCLYGSFCLPMSHAWPE